MFGHDVGRIELARQMIETNESGSNSFTYTMKGKSIVALVELGMQDHRTINNSHVVAKHVTDITDWDTKVMEGSVKINNLIDTRAGSNKLRTISGSLNRGLLLGICAYHCRS